MPRLESPNGNLESSEEELVVEASASPNEQAPSTQRRLSHRPRRSTSKAAEQAVATIEDESGSGDGDATSESADMKISIAVPKPLNRNEYQEVSEPPEDDTVERILDQGASNGRYKVQFVDGRQETMTKKTLLKAPNGKKKLDMFNNGNHDEEYRSPVPKRASHIGNESSDEEDRSVRQTSMTSVGKRNRNSPKPKYKFAAPSDEEELSESDAKKQRTGTTRRSSRKISAPPYRRAASEDDSEVAGAAPVARSTRSRAKAKPISETRLQYFVDENEDDDNESIKMQAKGHRTSGRATTNKSGRTTRGGRTSVLDESDSASMVEVVPTRKSGRSTKASKSMRERPEDDEEVYADDSVASISAPRTVTVREVFQPLPAKNEFRFYHNNFCDVCGEYGNNSNKGTSPLIQCQSCTTAIHKICLGQRNRRDHLVTKIGEDNFVLQCKRCVGLAKKKDPAAPDLGCCWECKEKGVSCKPFSVQKTTLQEEKIREENDGVDPIAEVGPVKINNPLVLLFRCTKCQRGCHLNHLPPLDEHSHTSEDEERNTEYRFGEYSKHWQCKDCLEAPAKPSGIVAWRPVDQEAYSPDDTVDTLEEDAKEYLVRWEEMSYFRCTWMPGAWCWGVMSTSMRKAFSRKCYELNGGTPIVTEKDAIPEEYLRIEIVLDVKYSSRVSTHTEEVDKARITEVDQVLVKMIGLGYEEVVWESPPPVEDTERYADFQAAYCEYLAGKYFNPLVKRTAEKRLASYRAADFNKDLVMREQPKALIGGKLMEYQMDGMNWLCYNFHEEKNVILADEMGLGKTIQVIAALTALITEKPACYPFLIVVPNSTCPNWRREIKQWCPQLRVVAYYGTKEAREIAMEYELFPDGRSDLAAHIIVTSYEAPVDEKSRQFFKKIKWSGLIVDEGQRLKNDKNLLYRALQDLKIPWRVLLTGTPVQNNKLELFTLLQFLDSSVDACELDAKYETLTNENVGELWALIKPLILRRTKVQVLKFLPPMAQVIIPVTMSVVQKKLYKSILAKSPELLKAIYGKDHTSLKPQERGGLNNILMQLRKCLCHPFVYSEAIEERNQTRTVLHRNLVDASSKLQLLEIMLPKLQERGHRVLIFSQFLKQLDIVEDFLIGLGMQFHRLDGSVGTLEKQKRIDAFNAPDSPLFAFLLSTRAGGVGINLATADTVIIMDPDFNPHQDLQALSRAHRIGQKNKVLVFQLMTKDSAEEKIVQIGRKKMALDQAIIESMGEDDDAGVDVQTILQHGAAALFEENDENDIKYDSASVDKLLDRSQVEQTETSEEKTAESQFSFARIWQNDTATLGDDVGDPDAREPTPSADVWEKILKEREEEAQREELAKQKQFGRGKRVRQVTAYHNDIVEDTANRRKSGKQQPEDSDFEMGGQSESDREEESDHDGDFFNPKELQDKNQARKVDDFYRVKVVRGNPPTFAQGSAQQSPIEGAQPRQCLACRQVHPVGYCPLKRTGYEHCGLCGIPHFGQGRTCPNLQSETQVRLMLDALKTATESREEIEAARTYLRGVVGDLVRRKKAVRLAIVNGQLQPVPGHDHGYGHGQIIG